MEERTHVFFDGPQNYPGPGRKYFLQGSSPRLLEGLIDYLRSNEGKIKSIYASLFLFNNPLLHAELKRLAKLSIDINVVSIPLEGYDQRFPQTIIDLESGKEAYPKKHTKQTIAQKIYGDLKKSNCNGKYRLFIFPHMYIRSKNARKFSRGDLPYSLHIKSFFIEFYGGSGAVVLSTSNLAVRDLIKNEAMAIVENNSAYNNASRVFFDSLLCNSIPINEFNETADYTHYDISLQTPSVCSGNFFIGPFYGNSPDKSGEWLKATIMGAKWRIYICAQHISAYNYEYPRQFKVPWGKGNVNVQGFLQAAIYQAENGIDVRFLSQTFIDGRGESHGGRKPKNITSFKNFSKELEKKGICNCSANSSVHLKFIVIDDFTIITTCNFTPTQFIYLKYVDLPKIYSSIITSYKGIFSEVGQYLVLNDTAVTEKFVQHFNEISNYPGTYHHITTE